MFTFYLASTSLQRQTLLHQIKLPFSIIQPLIDEQPLPNEMALDYVKRLAFQKVSTSYQQLTPQQQAHACVLGADTIIRVDDHFFGKPATRQQAIDTLQQLSGRTHQVTTAITLYSSAQLLSESVHTQVTFRPLSLQEIKDYCHTGEPDGKAGSYAIQGLAATFIEQIQGDYYNVVGLPLFTLTQLLKTFDFSPLKQTVKHKP